MSASEPQPKLWSIQILRFVAALLVVHLHAVDNVWLFTHKVGIGGRTWDEFGHCGVDIFFVISGFIITRTSKGLTAGEFIARRARRILPLYWAISALWMLAYVFASSIDWRTMLATWLLWPATNGIATPIIPMGWTLCFEALFYAAFALVIWRPKTVWLIAALYVGALAFPVVEPLKFFGNPIILEFLAGVILAYVPAWRPATIGIPAGVAILVLGAVLHWPHPGTPIDALTGVGAWTRLAVLGIPAVLIVWGTLQLRAREGVFSYLGDASYALYLIHPPIVAGTVILLVGLAHLPPDLGIVAAMAAAVVVSWRVYELFEKPMLAGLKKMMDARGRLSASAAEQERLPQRLKDASRLRRD